MRELEAFLEAARLDWVAFFAWSPEDGTTALDLDGRVPAATARARVERVQEAARPPAGRGPAGLGRPPARGAGRAGRDDGAAEGRSFREAPDADGVVRVEGAPRPLRVGEYLPVVVTAAEGPELLARPAG